jgi:hypothetical protein
MCHWATQVDVNLGTEGTINPPAEERQPASRACGFQLYGQDVATVVSGHKSLHRGGTCGYWSQIRQVHAACLRVGWEDALVGGKTARSAGIAEDGGREWVNGAATEARRTERGVDPIVVHRLEGVDGDIDSPTDSKEDAINSLGIYGDEVGRDDSHFCGPQWRQ